MINIKNFKDSYSINILRTLRVQKWKYDKTTKITKYYYEYNIDIKQLTKNLNIEKKLLEKSDSKIKKHISIMINKLFKLREENKQYLDVIILDKFCNYFCNKLYEFYQLITKSNKENLVPELEYNLLFFNPKDRVEIDLNLLTGDILILYSLVSEYYCYDLNFLNYTKNLEKYQVYSRDFNIAGEEYPEKLLESRVSQFRQKISTEENFNIVAKFSSLNLHGTDFNKKTKKLNHLEEEIKFLSPYTSDNNYNWDYKKSLPKKPLLNKSINLDEIKFDKKYHSYIKFISLNSYNLLKLFNYNNIIDVNNELNIEYIYKHIILKILIPHNLTKIFFIVRDEYIIKQNYYQILNEFHVRATLQDIKYKDISSFEVLPFSNGISKLITLIIGDNSYEINLLSISEFGYFLGGLCFENAFLFKEGYKNHKFMIDYNKILLDKYLEEKIRSEREKEIELYYENIEREHYGLRTKKIWKEYNKLSVEDKLKKKLEPVSLNTVNKNKKISDKVNQLNHYQKNWFDIRKVTKDSLIIFQEMSYSHISENLLKYFININNSYKRNATNLISIQEGELHFLLHSIFDQNYRKILIESNHLTNPLLYKTELTESQKKEIQLNSYFAEFKELDQKNLELNLNYFKDKCLDKFKTIVFNQERKSQEDLKSTKFWDELLANPNFYNVYNIDKILHTKDLETQLENENVHTINEDNTIINTRAEPATRSINLNNEGTFKIDLNEKNKFEDS